MITEQDGSERAFEFPGATLATWEMEIVGASDEERAAMIEHNMLPEQHTLWSRTRRASVKRHTSASRQR